MGIEGWNSVYDKGAKSPHRNITAVPYKESWLVIISCATDKNPSVFPELKNVLLYSYSANFSPGLLLANYGCLLTNYYMQNETGFYSTVLTGKCKYPGSFSSPACKENLDG